MARQALLTIALMTAVVAAQADIDSRLDIYQPAVVPGSDPLVPDFNDGAYFTVDLIVTVYGEDDWTSTAAVAELRGGFFFEHPLGGDTPPDPGLFDEYPALEWDSHYASSQAGEDPLLGGEVINEHMYRDATWFAVPPNGGDGTFVLARYTVKTTCPESCDMRLSGAHTTRNHGGGLQSFDLEVVLAIPFSPPWDVDWDSCVDQTDLGILLAAYGSTPDDPEWDCRADIDADYGIGQSDLGLLLAHWGEGCP